MGNVMKKVKTAEENRGENVGATSPRTSRKTEDKTERKPDCTEEEKWTPGHEVEYCQYESELHDKKKNCKKNPGHRDFTPTLDFTLQHLPKGHRDNLVWGFIKTVIFLTVRVMVNYTSEDRPDDYKDSNLRGSDIKRVGTGMVWKVARKFTEKENGRKCPCRECKKFPDKAKTRWGQFNVTTALHVVYNSKECENSRCDVGYNRDEDKDKCHKLDGLEVWDSHIKFDLCDMWCVTHDENLINKMEKMLSRYYDLRNKLRDKYKRSKYVDMSKLPVICISHPHGLSKHVTVGKYIGQQEDFPHAWSYTTQTCPGSSGARVFTLGRRERWGVYGRYSHHSKSLQKGENQSGYKGL